MGPGLHGEGLALAVGRYVGSGGLVELVLGVVRGIHAEWHHAGPMIGLWLTRVGIILSPRAEISKPVPSTVAVAWISSTFRPRNPT